MNVTPMFELRLEELSRESDRTWLAGLLVGLGFTLVAAFVALRPGGGTACAYLGLLIRAALYLRAGETLADNGGVVLSRLFKLGLCAGAFELIVDWWLVNGISNGRLVYVGPNDVVLLSSPIWMPLAWACVITELGYPAVRLFGLLRGRIGGPAALVAASGIVSVSAGVTVGFYEYFAFRAGWWQYAPAHAMLGPACALYIPLGEAFMFLTIIPIAARALSRDDRRWTSAIEGGALFACAIFGGYALAYMLLEWGRLP